MKPKIQVAKAKPSAHFSQAKAFKGEAAMRQFSKIMIAVLVMTALAAAKELPNAPSAVAASAFIESTTAPAPTLKFTETKPVDRTFLSLALVSTASTFADSYTTLFARENYLAGKKGVCNMEVQSAYLYGTHPTVARTYAVASVKSASSIFVAYYMRKHHNRFWSLPLITNSVISLEGVTQNMAACN
jgi:hypothetical protein